MINSVSLNNFEIGKDKLTILAGPCAMESKDILFRTAEYLKQLTQDLDINFVFKCSYDKANRSSINSYRGLGMEKGLELLAQVKKEFNVPIVTDIHEASHAAIAAEVADILQIPAFLCRQTDLLVAAAKTNKIVNIKKGQFLAPMQMKSIANKVKESGNNKIILTDRGVAFGYNNLVSDMRAIPIMQDLGYPVIFDATHSVQKPGGKGDATGGNREYVEYLAKAAIAVGVDGLFMETHQNPDEAWSDGPNMVKLDDMEELLTKLVKVYEAVQ